MSWAAVAVVGGGIVGGLISSHGAQSAASTQADAANHAADVQRDMFNQTRSDQAPWRAAGGTSLAEIMRGFGLGDPNSPGGTGSGYFSHQFNRDDLNANLAPNYDFMLQQGQGAVTAQANRMGGLGANSLADISKYTTGYAQNAYQQAYSNYTANQTNIFNRLASIAGLGQTAGSNQTTGSSTAAGNIGNSLTSAGNALAAGQVGQANAWSGAINNATSWYQLNNLLNRGGSGLPGGPT